MRSRTRSDYTDIKLKNMSCKAIHCAGSNRKAPCQPRMSCWWEMWPARMRSSAKESVSPLGMAASPPRPSSKPLSGRISPFEIIKEPSCTPRWANPCSGVPGLPKPTIDFAAAPSRRWSGEGWAGWLNGSCKPSSSVGQNGRAGLIPPYYLICLMNPGEFRPRSSR